MTVSRLPKAAIMAILGALGIANAAKAQTFDVLVQNACESEMEFYLRYMPTPGNWTNTGVFSIAPGERSFLRSKGTRVRHNIQGHLYAYGETADGRGYFPTDRHADRDRLRLIKTGKRRYVYVRTVTGEIVDDGYLFRLTCHDS